MNWVQTTVFRLYEQRDLRNWFYTISFAIFVPIGYRFADLAWRYGSWIDKPLAVIAGIAIGIATVVTLMRIWHVPPKQTLPPDAPVPVALEPQAVNRTADHMLGAARSRAAQNRDLALHAAALGSSIGTRWH
jgi:hypothetical protein